MNENSVHMIVAGGESWDVGDTFTFLGVTCEVLAVSPSFNDSGFMLAFKVQA